MYGLYRKTDIFYSILTISTNVFKEKKKKNSQNKTKSNKIHRNSDVTYEKNEEIIIIINNTIICFRWGNKQMYKNYTNCNVR